MPTALLLHTSTAFVALVDSGGNNSINYGILGAFLVVVGAFLKYLTHRDKENREMYKSLADQFTAALERSVNQMDRFEERNAAEHSRIVEILSDKAKT